jgi:hypothetical protein
LRQNPEIASELLEELNQSPGLEQELILGDSTAR